MSKQAALLTLSLGATLPLAGCLVVGHSTGGGWFIWPGSFGLLLVVVLILLLLRRR